MGCKKKDKKEGYFCFFIFLYLFINLKKKKNGSLVEKPPARKQTKFKTFFSYVILWSVDPISDEKRKTEKIIICTFLCDLFSFINK